MFALPDTLRDQLAALPEEALALYAGRWGQAEELDDWDHSDLVDFMRDLGSLCRQACSEQKSVYLWLSL